MTSHITYSEAQARLENFPMLKTVLGETWLATQSKLPNENWSLITGWLFTSDLFFYQNYFAKWLGDLDYAIQYLQSHIADNQWKQISKKIRSPSDRSNTKAIMAETSFALFLANNGYNFLLEQNIDPDSKKDVDFTILSNDRLFSVEIHYLGESEREKRLDKISAAWGGIPFTPLFAHDKQRIQYVLRKKAEKFVTQEITLVALCISEIVGANSTINEAVEEAFNGANNADYILVDGVLWYSLKPGDKLQLKDRHIILNPRSKHLENEHLNEFIGFWTTT